MTGPAHSFAQTAERLFHGNLSARAQGFLLVLPEGATGRTAMRNALREAYGSEVHPDVWILEGAEGGAAKVADVRKALAFAYTHPTAGGMKTLWVPEADALTKQASNAFLKTLEEPSRSTRVLLGAGRPERLLPTTRSRCITLSVRGDAALALQEVAEGAPDSSPQDAQDALESVGGAVDAAARLLKTKGGVAWARAATKAISTGDMMPVPPIGAQGLDAATVACVVLAALTKGIQQNLPGADARADAAAPYLMDVSRPGIDTGGRARALARALAAA